MLIKLSLTTLSIHVLKKLVKTAQSRYLCYLAQCLLFSFHFIRKFLTVQIADALTNDGRCLNFNVPSISKKSRFWITIDYCNDSWRNAVQAYGDRLKRRQYRLLAGGRGVSEFSGARRTTDRPVRSDISNIKAYINIGVVY